LQAGNNKYDLERAEREAKEKLMAKRKLQALNQKKDEEAEPRAEHSDNEAEESSDEAEEGEVEDTPTAASFPSQPPIAQPTTSDTSKKKEKRRRPSKAERRAKKRKSEQLDQGGSRPKKKKTGRGKNKQDRSPPADR
jgi:exosome complex protein LRP1